MKQQLMQEPNPPVIPERDMPVKPDRNPDPTQPKPGGNEPQKTDPTRIDEPPLPKPEQPKTS
jgi:hypothetical protein